MKESRKKKKKKKPRKNHEMIAMFPKCLTDNAAFDKTKQKCSARADCFNSEHNSRRQRAATRQQDRFVVLTSQRDGTATASALRT